MIEKGVNNMRQKIYLETMNDIAKFVQNVSTVPEDVFIEDGLGSRVTAKSLMFTATARMYWAELYVTCSKDIYMSIKDFIVDESPNEEN
jgi:hypothetical protein